MASLLRGSAVDSGDGSELDLNEIQRGLATGISILFIVVSTVPWWLTLPEIDVRWREFVVFFSLTLVGVLTLSGRERFPKLSQLLLITGPLLSVGLSLLWFSNPETAYMIVLIVIVGFGFGPSLGLVAVLAGSLLLALADVPGDVRLLALAILWLTAAVELIFSRGQYIALGWAWNSQQNANHLLDELRTNRGRLNRAMRSMDEANARLALANERLREARRIAEEARRAKSRFAASVSHELRTPLNIIVGFAEVMYDTPEAYPDAIRSPELVADLGAVYRSAQHLQKLVDDVLDLAQLDAGKFELQSVETDLGEVVQEAVDTVRNMAVARGLALTTQLPHDLPRVYTDRTRIKQVVLNLVSNAIRYTEQGSITVAVEAGDGALLCSVTDTGAGIPEEQQGRLFEEFERMSGEQPSKLRPGSGLGLSISKRLVRQHGGRIWVESRPGVGSTFTFSIPIDGRDALLPAISVHTPPAAMDDLQTEKQPLLLITGSLTAARLFSRYLYGYHCITTGDIGQAIRQIADLQPRGIVVDAAFGESAVVELSQAVVETSVSSIPLITCPMPGHAQMQKLGRIHGYLTKPVTRRALLEVLRTFDGFVETILVVDDDEHVVRLFKHYLEDDAARSYQVSTAHDGREALRLMAASPPDLVFLDLFMPTMDGYSFLREKERTSDLAGIPVVIVSGQDIVEAQPSVEGWLNLKVPRGMGTAQLIHGINDLVHGLQGTSLEAHDERLRS